MTSQQRAFHESESLSGSGSLAIPLLKLHVTLALGVPRARLVRQFCFLKIEQFLMKVFVKRLLKRSPCFFTSSFKRKGDCLSGLSVSQSAIATRNKSLTSKQSSLVKQELARWLIELGVNSFSLKSMVLTGFQFSQRTIAVYEDGRGSQPRFENF